VSVSEHVSNVENTRRTIQNISELEMDNDSDESRIIRERFAGRENRNRERVTGVDQNGWGLQLQGDPVPWRGHTSSILRSKLQIHNAESEGVAGEHLTTVV